MIAHNAMCMILIQLAATFLTDRGGTRDFPGSIQDEGSMKKDHLQVPLPGTCEISSLFVAFVCIQLAEEGWEEWTDTVIGC